jgi:hypothetical protein
MRLPEVECREPRPHGAAVVAEHCDVGVPVMPGSSTRCLDGPPACDPPAEWGSRQQLGHFGRSQSEPCSVERLEVILRKVVDGTGQRHCATSPQATMRFSPASTRSTAQSYHLPPVRGTWSHEAL